MFGLLQNSKSVDFYFVNNIIAIIKFCIIIKRNFAVSEKAQFSILKIIFDRKIVGFTITFVIIAYHY